MLILLLIVILLLAGILPGIYRSLKHILGWKILQRNAVRYLEKGHLIMFLLRTGLFMVFSYFMASGVILGIGFGALFALLNIFILNWLKQRQWGKKNYQSMLLSGVIAGGVVGGILAGFILIFAGGPFSGISMIGLSSIMSGGIRGGFVNAAILFIQFIEKYLSQIGFTVIAPLFILLRFATIICNHCYRVTVPLKSRYELGRRYCEHCQHGVEDTKEIGKVIFTFGEVPLIPEGRVFVLADPDFEDKEHYVEVSEVYLNPNTTDKRLFERFITYIVNYPPKHGIHSVKIFYQGQLDDLGPNLKNALQNIFECVEKFS